MNFNENDLEFLEPWTYIKSLPGKGFRTQLIEGFQHWLQVPIEKETIVKTIIESLHDASLLIDDIEDDSELRRGQPVAHAIYGIPTTINCANYVYFLALQECNKLNNPEILNIYVNEMICLHRGQGKDIIWREKLICPTEDQYNSMVIDKTGGLFRLAVGILQTFSQYKNDFTNLLNKVALYFQIRDDYMNLVSISYMENKSFCEDLYEGKFSFPLIHAIRKNEEDRRILNILKQKTKNIDLKKHAVEYMKKMGSFQYTYNRLKELKVEVFKLIQEQGGNPFLCSLIDKLENQTPKPDQVPST